MARSFKYKRYENATLEHGMISPRNYLDQLNSSIIRLGLGPVKRLLDALGNPQKSYASVLIGGTNGKGSIAAATASILAAAGYRVGLYTSPHLIDLRERIRVNGKMIGNKELDDMIEEVRGAVKRDITYFEVLTALAFLHFSRVQVDVAVLEVGMGGRLDATNLVTPVVSVISNISLEHKEYLGDSLAEIAGEKAGIIKKGGACITAAGQKTVIDVLDKVCREKKAKLYRLGRDIKVRRHGDGAFSYYGIRKNYRRLFTALAGRHQIENAALALGALEILAKGGFPADDRAVFQGMRNTRWEGRLETLQELPRIVVDGGHNSAGISVLCRALKEDLSYRRLILIFAVLGDKDFTAMVKKIAPLADRIIITKPENERAVPSATLYETARRFHKAVEIVEPVERALKRAMEISGKGDMILAAGSLYLVGEIKKAVRKINLKP